LGADCGEKGTYLSNDDSVNSDVSAKDWIYFYYSLGTFGHFGSPLKDLK